MTEPLDLRVDVDAVPEPGFLRPAIEAALAGRPWQPGPEAQIAGAIVAAMSSPYAGRPAPGIRTSPPDAGGGEAQ
jgi:hypothetical protein